MSVGAEPETEFWTRRKLALSALAGAAIGGLLAWHAPPGAVPAALERPAVAATTEPEAEDAAEPVAPEIARCDAPPPSAREAAPAVPPKPSIYAKTRFVWIRELPDWGSQWIGYLWIGGSVPLKRTRPIYARGCREWYAVEPRGYVCLDSRTTLDASDPEYVAVRARAANLDSPNPHRYAESLGAERYFNPPAAAEQRLREPDLPAWTKLLDDARAGNVIAPLVGIDLTPAPEDAVAFASLPSDLQIQRRAFRRRSTIAYLGEYRHEDRSFLLTSDLAWVPKDRVKPFPEITFRGIRLDGSVELPIAFFRRSDRPAFVRDGGGAFIEAAEHFGRLDWTPLTGRQTAIDGTVYLETKERGLWVRTEDAVVPTPSRVTPWGVAVGKPDPGAAEGRARPGGRATWVEVSLYGGWLVAFEGSYPVFTTLIAPGRGGAPREGRDPLETNATPVGRFAVSGKFATANMDAPGELVHSDVPWVQNFTGPYSLHGAYWHDAWGERVSGGCVNLSPIDGKWLFAWSEPRLPPGWHGVRWDPTIEPATGVWIHR